MKLYAGWLLGLVLLVSGADLATVVPNETYVTELDAGAWAPSQKAYSLQNQTSQWIFWQSYAADGTAYCWPATGWIPPYSQVTVTVQPAMHMAYAPTGTYEDNITLNFESRVVGDLDGNGAVDVIDIVLMQDAFGTNSQAADFDNNGSVDVIDMITLINNFAKTYGATSI